MKSGLIPDTRLLTLQATVSASAVVGYVLFNKAFAWIHIPGVPFFWGEVVLLASMVYLLAQQRTALRVLRSSKIVQASVLLFIWGLLHLAWSLPEYGFSAARDGALTNYILVAFATATAVMSSEGRLVGSSNRLIRRLVPIVVVWAPVAVIVNRLFSGSSPLIPGSETPIVSFKPGDMAVWVAASIAYLWLVDRTWGETTRAVLSSIGVAGLLVIGTQNRGGALAALITLALTWLAIGRARRASLALGLVSAVLAAVFLLALSGLSLSLGDRDLSIEQLMDNVVSVGTDVDSDSQLQGTVSWRVSYWNTVLDDVLTSDDWLAGVGYGPNLADRYGFQTASSPSSQPLRNAHNSHLTFLARTGTAGLTLWAMVWVTLGTQVYRFRRSPYHGYVLWLVVVAVGIGVNAFFDPTLEGPQVAIIFWLIVGLLGGLEALLRGGFRDTAPVEPSYAVKP